MADYVSELEKKLVAARKRLREGREIQALKNSAPTLFEIIDSEISLELNRGYGEKPLTHEEYLESHGAARGMRRIRSLLNAREAEAPAAEREVQALQGNVEKIDEAKKKQK